MKTKITASDVIAFHEERGHGQTKTRWWIKLKGFVDKNGSFPPRLVFKAIVRPMYAEECYSKRKQAMKAFAPSRWENTVNPKIK